VGIIFNERQSVFFITIESRNSIGRRRAHSSFAQGVWMILATENVKELGFDCFSTLRENGTLIAALNVGSATVWGRRGTGTREPGDGLRAIKMFPPPPLFVPSCILPQLISLYMSTKFLRAFLSINSSPKL